MRVALATCREVPDLDRDGRTVLAGLHAAGIEAEPAVWDEPGIEWQSFDVVLLRSTWDYPRRCEEFLAWCERVGERLVNDPRLVRWNSSKRYLADLADWGLPTVPSEFISPGDAYGLPAEGEIVVKPATSAGSVDTGRYRAEDGAAAEHVEALLAAGREVLIQPYLASVDEVAETAVVVLGDQVSHSMRKGPLLELGGELEAGLFRQEEMSLREPGEGELTVARAAVAAVSERIAPPLYARVDLLRGSGGEPLILELELIEPSLFADFHPFAAARIAELVDARARA